MNWATGQCYNIEFAAPPSCKQRNRRSGCSIFGTAGRESSSKSTRNGWAGAAGRAHVESGTDAVYAATEVKRREDLSGLVTLACKTYGQLDVLVNNAGVGPISRFDRLRVEDWEDMIDINLKVFFTVLPPHCRCSESKDPDTLSMSFPRQAFGSYPPRAFTPLSRKRFAPSPRLCGRKPGARCA